MTTWIEQQEKILERQFICKNHVLVSFPKCGRTWVRMVLAKLLQIQGKSVKDYEMIYTVHKDPDDVEGRLGKTCNIVFLKRDPGDVILSYLHMILNENHVSGLRLRTPDGQEKHFSEVYPKKQVLWHAFKAMHTVRYLNPQSNKERSLYKERASIYNIVRYYNLWETSLRGIDNSLVLKYEDLLENPVAQFTNLVKFLDFECTDEELKEAIEFSSFENMKKIDNNPLKSEDKNINPLLYYKGNFAQAKDRVRKGKHKSYLEEFSEWPEIIEIIEEAKKKLIVKYD
tara:strand:- start:967 stop:1821 length:855 start_codon:yes stop_codon:yes gene_type:complete